MKEKRPMSSPLINALSDRHGLPVVDEAGVDGLLESEANLCLFFTGDPDRVPESNDVAVILPEVLKLYGNRMQAAVVVRSAERALQLRYRFNTFPTLVFVNQRGYLGALSRVLDWAEYLAEVPRILAAAPSEPPSFVFPNGCGISSSDGQTQALEALQ
jgi:hydrogenase-1 operon protein HyaE